MSTGTLEPLNAALRRALVAVRPDFLDVLMSDVLVSGLSVCTCTFARLHVLRALGRVSPDVLLLDVALGSRYGGLELLLNARVTETVTTVLVADDVDEPMLSLARQAGASGLLAWPWSQAQLDATLGLARGSIPRHGLA